MLISPPKIICIFSIPFFLFAGEAFTQEIEAGRVFSKVNCRDDSTHSYALYLPSYYYDDPELEWPVIYAFDAAARGSLPVELFRDAAEKYGYIIAGSNISENGPWEPILKAAETMIKDTEARFRIDKTRRYTSGFSGGARVATSLAVLYGTFEGVIGCGAGFSPNYPPHFDLEISYIGLIGTRDFNYQEMKRLNDWLNKFNIDHYIYEYPGGHEWPPAEVITEAVTWLEFKAMKNELKWTDYGLREDFYDAHMKAVSEMMTRERDYDAYLESLKIQSYLTGVRKLDEVNLTIQDLKNKSTVKKEIDNLRRILEEERMFYSEYMDAFDSYRKNFEDSMTPIKPLSWWKEQLNIAKKKVENGKTPMDTLLGRRMIDFMWRTAYMQYENVQGTEYQSTSRFYLDIWSLVQPDAISPHYFLAKYYTLEGRYTKALESLNAAIVRGLDDRMLIENDSVLVKLAMLPGYQQVVSKMR